MTNYQDITIQELLNQMDYYISKGWKVYVKFTCPSCKSRQTCMTSNTFNAKVPDVPYDEMEGNYICEKCGIHVYPKKFGLMIAWAAKK